MFHETQSLFFVCSIRETTWVHPRQFGGVRVIFLVLCVVLIVCCDFVFGFV